MKFRMSQIMSPARLLVAGRFVAAGLLLAVALGTNVFRRPVQSRVSQTALAKGPAPDPLANGITVVTYNTHLFKGSSSEVGFFFRNVTQNIKHFFSHEGLRCTAPIVFDDDNRARLIADKIKTSGADIVGLQEVWSYRRQQWFCRELASVYPYSCYPTHPRLALRTTSGLVLLSRYRLTDLSFSGFSHKGRPFFHDENWATKGVVTATVEAWPGGPTFRIGISHACTDAGGSSQPNIRQLASQTTTNHTGPAIMMGDLNVHRSKYGIMDQLFRKAGAVDAYVEVHGTGEGGETIDWVENRLMQYFWPGANVTDPDCDDRIDYVYVKPAGAGLRLVPTEAHVDRGGKYGDNSMDLSDHYPLFVKFRFEAQRRDNSGTQSDSR